MRRARTRIIGRQLTLASGVLALTAAVAAGNDRYPGLVDPTRPTLPGADIEEPAYSGPVLQSTMIAPGIKRAMISGKTYMVGDRLGAAAITDIHAYEVLLRQDGRETRLRLVPALGVGGRSKGVNP